MISFKKTAALLCAALLSVTTLTSGIAASAAEVSVRMNSVKSAGGEYMSFSGVQPFMRSDVLYVPARSFADASDMSVEWDQTTETALLTIDLENGTNSPIKQYAWELINKVSGYGLDVSPSAVSAALTAGDTNAVLRFIFKDTDGYEIAIGKTVAMSAYPEVVNDTTLMVPLRDTASIFGLDVDWDQAGLEVQISIPQFAVVPTNMSIIPVHEPVEAAAPAQNVYTEEVTADAPVAENKGTYLGRFKITHYCTCSVCNGGWGNNTAYAGEIIPGQTIAVDPNVIPPLSWVYIDGYGLRRAEDCGGAIQGNHIDMAVSSHDEAYRLGVVYKDVWLQ